MSFIAEMEQKSGVDFEDAQVALARQWLGPDEESKEYTVKIKFVKPTQGEVNNMGKADKTKDDQVKDVKVPATTQEAVDIIKQFESGAPRADDNIADTISQHVQLQMT